MSGGELLRRVARGALVAGEIGSVALMLRAGEKTPRFLLVGFVFWVLMPFAAAEWARRRSPNWTPARRATLDAATIAIALGSLAAYSGAVPRPAGAPNAFLFVATPPLLTVLLGLALLVAARASRRSR